MQGALEGSLKWVSQNTMAGEIQGQEMQRNAQKIREPQARVVMGSK